MLNLKTGHRESARNPSRTYKFLKPYRFPFSFDSSLQKPQSSPGASPPMAAPTPLALKRSYRCVSSLQQFYSGGPFAVSSDGASLACACGDEIKIVNSSDACVLASLGCDSESVTAFTFSPYGCFLFSAGHSRLIRVWDLSSRKCVRSWKVRRNNRMHR